MIGKGKHPDSPRYFRLVNDAMLHRVCHRLAESLYHCVVTATTVGYGDVPIMEETGPQGPRARKTPSWATWVSGGQSIQVQWWFGLSYLVLKSHLTFDPQIQKQSCNILGIYIPYIHPLGLWFILSITVKLSETTPYSHHAKLCGIGIPANFVAVHNSKKLEIYNDLCRYYSFI